MRAACFLTFGVLAMVASGCVATGPPSTITKTEARSLSRAEVKARVLQQLADLVTEVRPGSRRPPVNPLTDVSFETRPRATEVNGLCRLDRLTVTFRPLGREWGDADTPVTADGFYAIRYYHFTTAPTQNYNEARRDDGPPDDAQCQDVNLWDADFFAAPDEQAATDGFLLMRRVVEAITTGRASFPFTCTKHPVEADRECVDIVRQIGSTPISDIERCEMQRGEPAFALCHRVLVGDRRFRIISSAYLYGPGALPSLTVLGVEMDALITLIHERVD